MINYEELEDAALYGIEESLNNGGEGIATNETCCLRENGEYDYQGIEIAEALYIKFMGWC